MPKFRAGIKENTISGRLGNLGQRMMPESGDALVEELEEVELPEVKIRTPVLTRALQNSERVEGPEIAHGRAFASIAAGGPDVDYAIKVHEDLEMFHPRGGQAKFIESVVLESRPYILQRVANRINWQKMVD